jgi:hypothetical protein
MMLSKNRKVDKLDFVKIPVLGIQLKEMKTVCKGDVHIQCLL